MSGRFLFLLLLLGQLAPLWSAPAADFNRIDLTSLNWFLRKGFDLNCLKQSPADQAFKEVRSFPILPNNIFEIPIGNTINHFCLKTSFNLGQERRRLAIHFRGLGENYAIYLNGQRLVNEVHVKDNDITINRYARRAIVPLPHELLKNKNQLTLHLVGHAPATSLTENLIFGINATRSQYLDKEDTIYLENSEAVELILYGAYLFFGIYFLFFFLRQRKDTYNLYFAAFTFSLATYFLAFTDYTFQIVYDVDLIFLAGYASQPAAVAFFTVFFYRYFWRTEEFFWLLQGILGANALVFLAFFVAPTRLSQTILLLWYPIAVVSFLYIIYMLIKAIRQKLPDGWALGLSMAIALLAVGFEMLDTLFFDTAIKVLHYAYFLCVLVLVGILANRFLRVSDENERLYISEQAARKEIQAAVGEREQLAALNKELDIARRIQESLLPHELPQSPNYTFTARYIPAAKIGGDFYDFHLTEKGIGLLIADVSGHGIPAGLIASMVKLAFAQQKDIADDPAGVLEGMNRILCGHMGTHFVTANYTFFNINNSTLQSSNAGHLSPVHLRSGAAEVDVVPSRGRLLGFDEQSAYPAVSLDIAAGDRIVVYTDGLTEVRNKTNDQLEDEGLHRLLAANNNHSLAEMASRIMTEVRAYNALGNSFEDDLTMVIFEYRQ